MEFLIVILKIGTVLALVLLNGFFVAAEFAIVKVRSTQIEPLAKKGMRRAKLAQHAIAHLDAYLSATQLGITLASLGLGWLGEPFVAQLLEPAFVLLGITQPAVLTAVSFGIAFSFITFLHIVIGELAPKSLAIQRPQRVTLGVVSPLHFFYVVFRPFIWALNGAANFFLRLAGIQPVSEADLAHSEEELRLLLSKGQSLSTTGKRISLRAIELRDRTVREVMVPRTSVVYLSAEKPLEDNVALALENQFTRYPLCENDLDHVLGMIHLKDLFKLKGERGSGSKLVEIKREMLFVPETTPLERLLSTFLTKRVLMAIAVDEHGGAAGLVTLENILEELVGEIRDEFDVEPTMVQKISDTEFLVDGSMPLHEFAGRFEIVPDTKDFVSVSGYAIHLLGRLPERNATLKIGQWTGTIDAIEGRKIKSLRLKRVPTEDEVKTY